jgi:acetyl-CoA C-acetyltransferase
MIDPRTPCLIGTARRTWHPGGEPAPEPLAMWAELAGAAARDASEHHDVLGAVDDLSLVHCQSWAYDHPVDRLAQRLGLDGARRSASILAGTSPQRLIDDAARRMLEGRTQVALVVGGEALATRRAFDRAGEPPPWSHPHPAPPTLPVALDEWYLPTELAHGVLPAWLTFALLEQARWAARGGDAATRAELHAVIGRLRAVADRNPDAWFTEPARTEDLVVASPTNRMVATPYTKRMTAFMDVDMAAANLLVTKEVADRWQIPDDRRAYLRGWGFARDAIHIAARRHLGSSPAMRAATTAALRGAGLTLDDVDGFDLYSCFGSAVQFALDALGIAPDDGRPISFTGGLPYHGGPSSNYMGHSLSHVTDRLRAGEVETALITGVGMHMTKHVAAVWSRTPGPIELPRDPGPQQWGHSSGLDDRPVVDRADGTGSLVAATVVHDHAGQPEVAIGICERSDGSRCYVRTPDDALVAAIVDDDWAGRTVRIGAGPQGTNVASLPHRRRAPEPGATEAEAADAR